MLILFPVTLALWATGFVQLPRLRPCDDVEGPKSTPGPSPVRFEGRAGSFRRYPALLYPLQLGIFSPVYARSALRAGKRGTGKGRDIDGD